MALIFNPNDDVMNTKQQQFTLSDIETTKRNWLRISLLCLSLVALWGAMMRYKIIYSFPLFEQNNLLHAHSHFAFSGWVSHILYVGLTAILSKYLDPSKQNKYHWLIFLNLVSAFGMLIAFSLQGYKAISITFSTLSVIVAALFTMFYILDSKHFPADHPSKQWAIFGLIFNVLSIAGPFSLAFLMVSKNPSHVLYQGSIYYYLHFQYNGWFLFGTIALIIDSLSFKLNTLSTYCKPLALTVIPAYFLSMLWANLPTWLYGISIVVGFAQVVICFLMLKEFLPIFLKSHQKLNLKKILWSLIIFSITLKIILQSLILIPQLGDFVYANRAIVIAYLHLALLGVFSLYILTYLFQNQLLPPTKYVKIFISIFLLGIALNEIILIDQSLTHIFSYTNELLLIAAILLLFGSLSLFIQQEKNRKNTI